MLPMNEPDDFKKRINDLASRCDRTSSVTSTVFLTPAELFELSRMAFPGMDVQILTAGGTENAERKVAFFLPYYEDAESFDPSGTIKAVKIQSYFGEPAHRDYLGAVLGLGIERDRIGDIVIDGDKAYVFCIASVAFTLLNELDKVGRCGVKVSELPLNEVPAPRKNVKIMSFTVKSLRLDAVAGDIFGISRTQAAELIRLGAVTLNYSVCDKTDAPVGEDAVISIRGKGKGRITEIGGKSRKDRLFITAERYL